MAKKKFYAVAVGKKIGIYENWPITEAQVKGYPGARYKGFPTQKEAQEWLANLHCNRPPATKKKKAVAAVPSPVHNDGEVVIYTDGGAINNPGPGGYGVVLLYGEKKTEFTGGFRLTTNNRMELMGAIVALRELEVRDKPVTLYSDSSYVVNGINKGWAKKWRRNGWIKSDRKPAINQDLWAELLELVEELDVQFKWVKGHAGNPLNERCDQLAVTTARTSDLPVDHGYEST